MTREDSIKILAVLRAAYPSTYKSMTRDEAEAIINLWAMMFAEEDYQIVQAAVKAHIATDTSAFAPPVGKIKEAIAKLKSPDEMTEAEAWALVAKALRNSAYNASQEFAALPPICQKLVGSPVQLREWGMAEDASVLSVAQSNFMRSYKARQRMDKEYEALPLSVKQLFLNVGNDMQMIEDRHERMFDDV